MRGGRLFPTLSGTLHPRGAGPRAPRSPRTRARDLLWRRSDLLLGAGPARPHIEVSFSSDALSRRLRRFPEVLAHDLVAPVRAHLHGAETRADDLGNFQKRQAFHPVEHDD